MFKRKKITVNKKACKGASYDVHIVGGGEGVRNLDPKLRMVDDGGWGEGGGSKGKMWTSTPNFYFCRRKI